MNPCTKRFGSKMLSLLMTLAMVFTLLPIQAFAKVPGKNEDARKEELRQLEAELLTHANGIRMCRERVTHLYENLLSGTMDRETYLQAKSECDRQLAEHEAGIENIRKKRTAVEQGEKHRQEAQTVRKSMPKRPQLTRELISHLIEQVTVDHEKCVSVQFQAEVREVS